MNYLAEEMLIEMSRAQRGAIDRRQNSGELPDDFFDRRSTWDRRS